MSLFYKGRNKFRKFFEALEYAENTINSLGDEKNKRLNEELGYKIVDELIPEERLAGSKTAKEICENLDISYLRFRSYTDPGYRRKRRKRDREYQRKRQKREGKKREFEKNIKNFFKKMDEISESVSFIYSEEGRNLDRELLSEIIDLRLEGNTYQEIADKLGKSKSTVSIYLNPEFRKYKRKYQREYIRKRWRKDPEYRRKDGERHRKKRVKKIAKSGLLDEFSHEGGANLENVAEEYGMTVYQVLANIGDCVKMEVISSENIKIK